MIISGVEIVRRLVLPQMCLVCPVKVLYHLMISSYSCFRQSCIPRKDSYQVNYLDKTEQDFDVEQVDSSASENGVYSHQCNVCDVLLHSSTIKFSGGH